MLKIMEFKLLPPLMAVLQLLLTPIDALPVPAAAPEPPYVFQTGFHRVQLDHFSFTPAANSTFPLRYIYNDTYWHPPSGPIFLYTGNEGDIELFAQNTGFMWDLAPEFGALLLFIEHRYYGSSLPFGNDSFGSPAHSGYLSSEQALADFAEVVTWFKWNRQAEQAPVIAFGGSYGGMLTAWLRTKYPHIVAGGIAASAPIAQFGTLTPCGAFGQIVTADFARESKEGHCVDAVNRSWTVLNEFGASEAGRTWLSNAWRLCTPLRNESDIKSVKDWLVEVYGNLAMVDYPYETNFLAPLPPYPIKVFCSKLPASSAYKGNDKLLLKALFKSVSVYFNYTGSAPCLDVSAAASSALGDRGWDYQACTEMVMPMCTDGERDFFEPSSWNLSDYANQCRNRWGVTPRPSMAALEYGGRSLAAASNLVLSNGLLDPWSAGGVMQNVTGGNPSVLALVIEEGAHHLDLRGANPADPPSVVSARNVERAHIRKWIAEHGKSMN